VQGASLHWRSLSAITASQAPSCLPELPEPRPLSRILTMQAELDRVSAEAAEQVTLEDGEPQSVTSIFSVLADILQSKGSSERLIWAAATLVWALAVNASARAVLLQHGAVLALLHIVHRLAGQAVVVAQAAYEDTSITSATSDAAHVSQGQDRGHVDQGQPALTHKTLQHRAAGDCVAAALDMDAGHTTLEAALAALAVFMVDPGARRVLVCPSLHMKTPFLLPFFKLASMRFGDVDSTTAREQGAQQKLPLAEDVTIKIRRSRGPRVKEEASPMGVAGEPGAVDDVS
jgi:hypothetical protein